MKTLLLALIALGLFVIAGLCCSYGHLSYMPLPKWASMDKLYLMWLQVEIPAKLNAHSEGKPNGIPG